MSAYLCVDNVRVCASMPVCGQHASAQRMCVCVCAQRPSAQLSAQSTPTCLRVGVGFQRLAYQQGVINLWNVSVSPWWPGSFAQLSSC